MIDNQASASTESSNLKAKKSPKGEQDDIVLWREFRNGDYTAFNLLYKKYVKNLYNFGRRISTDEQLVEDAIHDFFIDLWRNRSTLGDAFSLKYYLMKGLKRKLVKIISKEKRNLDTDALGDYTFEVVFSHEAFIIDQQISKEQKEALERCLADLTDRQREALYLRYFEGLCYEEIASMMSISMKRAYNLVNIGIAVLRKKLVSCILFICLAILLI